MTSAPIELRFRDYAPSGEAFHLGQRQATGSFRGTLHTHDFAEVMWLADGALTHMVNGMRQVLVAGDIVFVRPTDAHTFVGHDFRQLNVAFARPTLEFLERRYFDGADWPWRDQRIPVKYHLERRQLARLTELAHLLASSEPTQLLLERFLLEVLHELVEPAALRVVPAWLEEALRRLADDPEALTRGVPALASFAGRSGEHVNRVCRSSTGRTATEAVNELRLTRAAADLRLTETPIASVAADCGLPNLSHFYRLFNARYGVTPRQLRIRHRALV